MHTREDPARPTGLTTLTHETTPPLVAPHADMVFDATKLLASRVSARKRTLTHPVSRAS